MSCPICYEDNDMYTMTCGHHICHFCEIHMRVAATPTHLGRFIQCPLCRAVETSQGKRSTQSYEAELALIYTPKPPRPRQRQPRRRPRPHVTAAHIIDMLGIISLGISVAYFTYQRIATDCNGFI